MPPQIHLIDETWIGASCEVVSAAVADPANWTRWWPDLDLTVTRDRGLKGVQFAASGRYTGTVEIWLEPCQSGVILHHFLRLDGSGGRCMTNRKVARVTQRFAWHAKRSFWALKDDLERA